MKHRYGTISLIAFFLAFLCLFAITKVDGQVLLNKEWFEVQHTPASLTDEYALLILPYVGGANNDDLRIERGSLPLNGVKYAENWNGIQATGIIWIEKLHFVPGDGISHYILDNQGTGASQDRFEFYIDTAGLLIFDLHDADSTQHRVQSDITGWSLGSTHHIAFAYDLNADEIELYVDGASVDSTPDNGLASDTVDAIGTTTQIGANTSQASQLNGQLSYLLENYRWADSQITADYASGAGVKRVVGPNTIARDQFTDRSTGVTYWPRGKRVSAIVANANDATITTADGLLTAVFDGDELTISDGTGHHLQCFADGDPSSGTSVLVDDGAGSAVADIEKVGVSIDCADSYFAQGGDILDITTEDFEIDFWVKQDGDPAATEYIIAKDGGGTARYWVAISSAGILLLRATDAANDANFSYDITSFLDNRWHHIYLFADRSDISSCTIYIDGVSVTPTTSGTFPVLTLTNATNFGVGSTLTGALPFSGQLRDLTIHIGGTMRTATEILYRATHPLDYSANGWTLDGTREAWQLTEGSGTTNTAEVTTPGNDLTLSNAAAWSLEAFLSRQLYPDGGGENANKGSISDASNANLTLTSDSSAQIRDEYSDKIVFAGADDGDSVDHRLLSLTNGQEYRLGLWTKNEAIHDNSKFKVNIDGAGSILSRSVAKALDDRGNFARSFNLDGTKYATAANNGVHDVTNEDIGAWARIKYNSDGSGNQQILSKRHSVSGQQGYEFEVRAFKLRFFIQDGANDQFFINGSTDLDDGEWHFVAAIVDKSNIANCKVYVDGVDDTLSTAGTIGDIGSITSTQTFRLGAAPNAATEIFDGEVSEAGITYPADIMAGGEMGAAGEIAALFNNPGDPSQWPNSEDYWLCNDNAASTVVTGNNNNLTASANTEDFAVYNDLYWEQSFTADQAAITVGFEITGEPQIVADAYTLTPGAGTLDSGLLSDTFTQDGNDLVFNEDGGAAPVLEVDFDFTVIGTAKEFRVYGYYDGNLAHTVNVQAWDGVGYDIIGTLPDAVADTLYTFTLAAEHTIAGAVNVQIDHTGAGNMNHDLILDHVYVVDSIDATVYVDEVDLQSNPIANGGMESFQGGNPNIPTGWVNGGLDAGEMIKTGLGEGDTERHSGDFCAKFVGASSNEGISIIVSLKANSYNTLSFFAKGDTADERLSISTSGFGTAFVYEEIRNLTSAWVLYQWTFLIGADGTGEIKIGSDKGLGSTFYVDVVSLVRSDTRAANTDDKGDGLVPLNMPYFPGDF